MFEFHGPTQASIFGNFDEIKPKPEIISELLALFSQKNMLPGTFQEISFPMQVPQTRIRLESENHEWVLNIGTLRIDVEHNLAKDIGDESGDFIKSSVNEAIEILRLFLNNYKIKGHRLALNTKGFLPEQPKTLLDNIYTDIISPIEFYTINVPTEWNSRSVSRVERDLNGEKEIINVINTVNRAIGQYSVNGESKDFDRIAIGFDINTYQGNSNTRFDSDNIDSFYQTSLIIRDEILDQLRIKLNV